MVNGYAPGTWARGGPIAGLPVSVSTVLIDASEAAALDLKAEGFVQLFSGRADVPVPAAELYLVLATPYDLELVRVRDFDPTRFQLPAIMAGSFPQPHPAPWLADIAKDLLVIVLPGMVDLEGELSMDDLRPAWCAFARVVKPA